jgi:hypothetical protein
MSNIEYLRIPANKESNKRKPLGQRASRQEDGTKPLHPILTLQHTIGNRAVGRMIQAKLKIGQPGDKYEQEADRLAEAVVRMPSSQTEPEVTVSNRVQSQIDSLRGGGQPLPESVRSFFAPRFGRNFSGVRMHTDTHAADMAQSLNARAFTVGRAVVFGAGQYTPGTPEGQRILAHELTHVLQQEGNKTLIQRLVRGTRVNDCNEDNAEASSSPVSELVKAEQKAFELLVNALKKINSAEKQYQEAVKKHFSPKLDELKEFSDAYLVARRLRKTFGFNPNKVETWDKLRIIIRRLMIVIKEIDSIVFEYDCCKQGSCCETDPLLCAVAGLNCFDSDRHAYTTDQDPNRIVLCSKFWETSPVDRGLTIIHEVLHLAFEFITDRPSPAFHNAHNYEKFVNLLNN